MAHATETRPLPNPALLFFSVALQRIVLALLWLVDDHGGVQVTDVIDTVPSKFPGFKRLEVLEIVGREDV